MLQLDLILKTASDQSRAEVKRFWWANLFGIFFGILVRPGTDLGQDFSDMAFIFFVFFYIGYFLIINLLFYVTNLYIMCYFYIIC